MALSCPGERAAAVTAKMDDEIKQLEERTRELTAEMRLHEKYARQQESRSAASFAGRKTSRRWHTYRWGAIREGADGRRDAMEEQRGIVEENQRRAGTGKKWQRGIEVAEMLVALDSEIKECLARIDRERDHMEQLQQKAALLHDEQREAAIQTGGIAWALLSEGSRNADGALLQLKGVRALRERPSRRPGGWSDCSDYESE